MEPIVSVLVCTYNAEKFIESTVESILGQNFDNFELLILDNASTDSTVKILSKIQKKEPRLMLFPQEKNIGPYRGLNILLDAAKGKYIAINDHDDIWDKEKLQQQVAFLNNHKEYAASGCAIINWYEAYNKKIYRSQPEKADIAWHTTLLFRNSGYRYDTSIKIGTDFYFMKNILCQGKLLIYNFSEPWVLRRIFKGKQNLSGQWMRRGNILGILNLNINWFDKLALLNRRIFPQAWVERMVIRKYQNSIPEEYKNYFSGLL